MEQKKPPKVSVCIPTYNRAEYLKHTLPMLLNQGFQDFEIIVLDDCSRDNTEEVVRSFEDKRLIYARNETNIGIPQILNKLISMASGQYIMFCHDHDEYHINMLGEMVALLDVYPDAAYCFCGVEVVTTKGRHLRTHVLPWPQILRGRVVARRILNRLRLDCLVSAISMVRAPALGASAFDGRFGFLSDVDLWIRLALEHNVAYVAKPLIRVREREESHPFKRPNWRYISWIGEIYRVNLRRYHRNNYCRCAIGLSWFWMRFSLMVLLNALRAIPLREGLLRGR